MGKEYEDAIKEVKSRSHSVAELVALVKSMSGNLEQAIDGTVTHLLYSGSIVAGDGSYSASSVANSLRMNGVNVRHVGDSHVGKLLSDVNFKNELESAIQREYPNESPDKLVERFIISFMA